MEDRPAKRAFVDHLFQHGATVQPKRHEFSLNVTPYVYAMTIDIKFYVGSVLVFYGIPTTFQRADSAYDDPYFCLRLPSHDPQFIESFEEQDEDLAVFIFVDGICTLSIMTIGNRKIRVVSLPSYRDDAFLHAHRIRERFPWSDICKLEVEVFASAMDALDDAFDTEVERKNTTEIGGPTSGPTRLNAPTSSTSDGSTSSEATTVGDLDLYY